MVETIAGASPQRAALDQFGHARQFTPYAASPLSPPRATLAHPPLSPLSG